MEIEIYRDLMNYINLVNDRYVKLINGLVTGGVNIDDIFFVSNGLAINLGLVTFRDSTPYLIENYKKSFHLDGGMVIRKNMRVDDLLINNEDLSISSITVNGLAQTGGSVTFGNLYTDKYRSGEININQGINSNLEVNDQTLIFNLTNSRMGIINGVINNCTINMRSGRVGYIENEFNADTYILNKFNGDHIIGNILDFNNFSVGNLDVGNLIVANILIGDKLRTQNIYSNNHTEITDTITIQRTPEETTNLDHDLIIRDIVSKDIYCDLLNSDIYESPIQTQIPLHRNNDIRFQVTSCSFRFTYGESYSIILMNDIIFSNPFNFNQMTMFFNDYIPVEYYMFKPRNGLKFIISGFRSDTTNIYSILYLVDYFSTEDSKINISIIRDENNELSFRAGFVYYIYKFNYNYYI
jgi:hypothetical protein